MSNNVADSLRAYPVKVVECEAREEIMMGAILDHLSHGAAMD